MADKRIGELPSAPGVYDDTLLVAEQQGAAVKITVGQLRGGSSSGGGEVIAGPGVASGGATGQVLAKKSNADYDTQWIDPPQGGGGEVDLSLYAPKAYPVFTGSISMGRKAGTAIGESSFAAGSGVEASGNYASTEGLDCTASGDYSHAEGAYSEALGSASHAGGAGTIAAAAAQTAIGRFNTMRTSEYDLFIIGNGFSVLDGMIVRSNCFRVTRADGVYASGSYNTSGADYAEMFEWADGNPEKQDRAGLFVTLDGAKIRLAGPEDDYILGIVSGNPSVVGDVHDDQWQGMYLHDVFGRPIWGNTEDSNHTERRQKLNPNYDNTQKYTPRSQRPEWDAVGMLGKLVAVDDGTCQVNGWCAVGASGIATASESRTKYRVMERLNENHIRVMIL